MNTTSKTLVARDSRHFDKAFYRVDSEPALMYQLCSVLNSTLTQLMINTEGRTNLGGGLLEDVLAPSSSRREIDAAVFDVLGMTTSERDGVCEAVEKLVTNRIRRSRSV